MSYGKSYYQIRQEIEQAAKQEEEQSAKNAGNGETDTSSGDSQILDKPESMPTEPPVTEPPATEAPETEDTSAGETPTSGTKTGIGDHSADVDAFTKSAEDTDEDAVMLPPDVLAGFSREEEPPVTEPSASEDTYLPESEESEEEYDEEEDDTAAKPGVSGYRKQKAIGTVSVRQESGSYQRGVPVSLASVAKDMFPSVGLEKAIAAYIYLREGCPKNIEVPDEIRILAQEKKKKEKQLSNNDMQANLLAKINSLENKLKGMQQNLDMLTFLTAYIQYDRDGFTGERPKTVQDVRFGIPLEYLDKVETDFKNAATLRDNRRKRLKH